MSDGVGACSAAVGFVSVESNKWIFVDPSGQLGDVAPSGGAPPSSAAQERERADGAPPVEQEVPQMRRIPWQTPHCVDKDGKLLLSETGQEWLDKAVRRREKLAEEVRADAGESSFFVEAPIRKMWIEAQELDDGLAAWFKEADDEANHLSRRHPSDGCLKKVCPSGQDRS